MTAVRMLGGALAVCGLIAVGYAAHTVAGARVYQATERLRLNETAAADPVTTVGDPVSLFPGAVTEGSVIGELHIPSLDLAVIVAQGDSTAILDRAVGHLVETALPGERGNAVLAGHRDTFFRPLRQIRVGDAITFRTPQGAVSYVVEWTAVVSADAVHVIEPTDDHVLTLITCFPFSYIGSAPDRFIVRARATLDE